MGGKMWTRNRRHRGSIIRVATIALALTTYIETVASLPVEANQWPTFPRRNIAALARGGYLKGMKRSISTLAKNGQLPTFRSPYDETDKHEDDVDESNEKRNVASIARLRSYTEMKRNIQALARDGYRGGNRGQYNQQNDKRNVQSLARNGMLHKRDEAGGDEYFYPFYQNPVPPLSEIDGPFDMNELYDFQQSVNPDMFPPVSQLYKRSFPFDHDSDYDIDNDNSYAYLKRGSAGLPVHGLYRPVYNEPPNRFKRYILSLPDYMDHNDIIPPENADTENQDKRSVDDENEMRENVDKRHIGSLARLGLLPSFRYTGGRYSRSGRARLLFPSQDMFRKYPVDENFGIRQYLSDTKAESAIDTDDTDVPPTSIPAHAHPTGRFLNRPLNNELPTQPIPPPPTQINMESFNKNRWQPNTKETPKFYYFRSLKVPYHPSKRYLLLPAVDNILLRKAFRNSSLPSRRKNQ